MIDRDGYRNGGLFAVQPPAVAASLRKFCLKAACCED